MPSAQLKHPPSQACPGHPSQGRLPSSGLWISTVSITQRHSQALTRSTGLEILLYFNKTPMGFSCLLKLENRMPVTQSCLVHTTKLSFKAKTTITLQSVIICITNVSSTVKRPGTVYSFLVIVVSQAQSSV